MLMKKISLFLMCVLATISVGLNAQNITVKGTVSDASTGEGIAYAGVIVKGGNTLTGTTSDETGAYEITVSKNAVLVFSSIGYKDLEVPVQGRAVVDVALTADNEMLDETIVVAYGTARKSSFTGSASMVDAEKLENRSVSNVSNALQGAVAGVQTVSSSGTPGSGSSIIIRGIGSISSSQSPLIVVDGVPYEGSLNSIATQDIESMTVLKDAAANSMYGARGSNGVIIITTKGAKTGRAVVNFEGKVGFNTRAVPNYDVITDTGEYYEMMWEAYRNSLLSEYSYPEANQIASETLISDVLVYNKYRYVEDNNIIDPLTGKITTHARNASYKWNDNWITDPYRNGLRQEYNINVSGGNGGTQAYASLGYLNDKGYVVGSGFDRFSGRVKVDQKIGKSIKIGGNLSYAHTRMDQFNDNVSTNYSNIFMFSQSIGPIYPIYLYDENGNRVKDAKGNDKYDFGDTDGHARPYGSTANPYAQAKESIYKNEVDVVTSRAFFEWKFLKDFTFTANVAYDVFNSNNTAFMTPIGGDAYNVGGRGEKETNFYHALNANQLLNWSHKFGRHEVSALLGHETKSDKSSTLYGHMTKYSLYTNPEFANAAEYQNLTSYTSAYALEGYFFKGEYNFADRYYLTASIRRDGSSRFSAQNRWGTFWAVGASWRIKEEAFMKDIDWIDNLKLKASYGTQGNDSVGYAHNYTDLYEVNRIDGEAAFVKVLRGNPDLTWEKSNNLNIGLESSFLNRITFNFDFFIKETKDLLYASPLAPSEGNPAYIYRNEMDMKNTGFEIELAADIIKTNNIRWNVSVNGTHYKNQLTKLPVSKPASEFPNGYQAGNYWRQLGGSLYDWYTYDYAGVDPTNGKPLFNVWEFEKDKNGNETSNYVQKMVKDAEGNMVPLQYNEYSKAGQYRTGKSAIPDFVGGLSTTFEAYGFDLSLQASYQLGGWVMDSYYQALMSAGDKGHNFHKDMFARWTPAHTDTNIPALNYENQNASPQGTFFLTSASYFSLNNVTLGYTLPKNLTKRIHIDKLRIFVTGDNVWMTTHRKGLDPRQSFSGETGYVYSALATYAGGIQLTF